MLCSGLQRGRRGGRGLRERGPGAVVRTMRACVCGCGVGGDSYVFVPVVEVRDAELGR